MKDKEWLDLHKEKGIHLLDGAVQECLAQFSAVITFSKMAINGAIILNGSSAIAILYNFEKLNGNVNIYSLLLCSIGAALAVLSSGLSYITQSYYSNIVLKNAKEYISYYYKYIDFICNGMDIKFTPPNQDKANWGHVLNVIAALVWLASICCFAFANIIVFNFLFDELVSNVYVV